MILYALGILTGILLSFLIAFCMYYFRYDVSKFVSRIPSKHEEVQIIDPTDPRDKIVPENYEYQADRRENLL